MRQSRKVISFLERECKKYCKQLDLQVPHLIFSDKELQNVLDQTEDGRIHADVMQSNLGVSWHRRDTGYIHDIIYINLHNTDYMVQVLDTLVHELVHLRCPTARHGDSFQQRVNSVILGDKQI